MKRTAGWLAGVLLVSGCAVITDRSGRLPDDKGFDPAAVRAPQSKQPNVFVVKGSLVVDQEPIRLWLRDYDADKDRRTVRIAWALDANSDVQWPDPSVAIVFDPDPKLERPCEVRGARKKVLVCTLPYRQKATFKYTLKALDGDIRLPALDPNIVNME